ncbi:MAG: dephospho-CoA kinase [Oleiphilus sp.]
MLIVGLSGGIGSGKTAASDTFAELGVNIIDADIVAREVVEPGSKALKSIAKHFGNDILLNDGSLNRANLRQRIFSSPEEKSWLENLLHPIIRQEIKHQLSQSNSAYTILVSPLLFETDQQELVDRTLLIDVPEELQITRASQRDNNSAEQIQKIIDSQLPRNVKLKKADDVICNDKAIEYLKSEIEKIHSYYLELAHEQNSRG